MKVESMEEGAALAFHHDVAFPSEAEALRKLSRAQSRWTATQRLLAVVDTLAAAETLSHVGGVRDAQLQYQSSLEDDWCRRMKEFIARHVAS